MHYSVVKDSDILREFINWLPELKEDERYYLALFGRKKYDILGIIENDKQQLKRVLSKKEDLYSKIKQLECPLGAYTSRGIGVPEGALALYISINPRSLLKAAKNSIIELVQRITKDYDGYNPQQLVMSETQKACGTKHFVDLDFDTEDIEEIVEKSKLCLNPDALHFLRTRGGIHILVEVSKIDKVYEKTWYKSLSNIADCDIKGDNLIPVPGCVQGDFIPHFIEREIL
jgi:hypothetical protein